jgi:hypothetical protein
MAKNRLTQAPLTGVENKGKTYKNVGRGSAGPFDSGFSEGQHGRGPVPYKASQSSAAGTLEQHDATSGRGGDGIIGKGDGFKTRAPDVSYPQTHAEFEQLGRNG